MTRAGGIGEDGATRIAAWWEDSRVDAGFWASLREFVRPMGMAAMGRMARLVRRGLPVLLLGVAAAGPAQSGAGTAKDPACVPVNGADAAKADGTRKGCPAGEHVPSVAEQFPFPGEAPAEKKDGKTVKDQFPYPGDVPADAPGDVPGKAPAAAPKDGGAAADRFPYPGEKKTASGEDGSSSSSSGSNGGGGADGDGKPALKDEGSEGEVQPQHRRRLRPQAQKTLSDDERVEEDLSVAHFYQQNGNTMGAYLRAKDAVKLEPGAADTHLAVARAAEKLGKRDEALAEYRAAVAAEPDGDGAAGAKKALERLKR